ncbi:MAG TPA: glycine cleavage system protein GcvH [Candidatus Nanopelagicaceae bacterium]|jgi:glycine cleavage system H protein|nr:glycine cleavage system protein GcvH [Candidatus Nanopelagicaceae bacterium]
MDYEFPDNLKYTKTHEWVRIEDKTATVGITDYAQHQLGDIVYIELPEKGANLERQKSAGEIESVKAVGELLIPLSGKIIEINSNLVDNPEVVNSSPYESGWMLKLEYKNELEINDLLSVEDYKRIVEEEN